MKRYLTVPACIAALAIAACGGESQLPEATGKGTVQAINAISSSPTVAFLIEERNAASIEYKNGSGVLDYDDLDYTFNFETILDSSTGISRIASQPLDVIKDTLYTMVLGGDLSNPTVTLWERPKPDFPEGATNFEVQVGHVGQNLNAVDVYLADAATPPALGNALGTIAVGDILPVSSFESGNSYVLTLTKPNDVSETGVLFESDPLTGEAGAAYMILAFDPDGQDLTPIAMRRFNLSTGAASRVADVNFDASFRVFHASADAGPIDIYSDDPLTEPVFAGLAFGDISDETPMPDGTVPVTVTAADNQGVIIDEGLRTIFSNSRYFAYLIDDASGSSLLSQYIPDLRSVETFAKLSVIATVPTESGVDVYTIRMSDETPALEDTFPSLVNLNPALAPIQLTLPEGSFEIYVTPAGEKTALAGPIQLDLANGDIVQAIIYENVDPSVVDVVLLPLP